MLLKSLVKIAGSLRKSGSPALLLRAAVRPVIESMEDRLLLSAGLLGDAISYPEGNFTNLGMSLNAGTVISNQPYSPRLGLTDVGANEARSAFYTQPLDARQFSTDFSFQVGGVAGDGATGATMTFTLQNNAPNTVGASGAGGYGGINKSAAIAFTTANGINGVALGQNGSIGAYTDLSANGIDFRDGDTISVHAAYAGGTLTVTETDPTNASAVKTATQAYSVNVPGLLGGNTAYAGFTAGNGSSGATQEVIGWTFADIPPTDSDIGSPSAAGSSSLVDGAASVSGAGAGFTGTSDQFHFTSRAVPGDQQLVASVTGTLPPASAAREGLMIRDGSAPNAPFAFVGLSPGGAVFEYRSASGQTVVQGGADGAQSGWYFKLVRDGNTFSGYRSDSATDGWKLVGTAGIPMDDTVSAGLAVASGSSSSTTAATFSALTVMPTAPIGVDTGDAGIWYKESDQMWVNVINQAEAFASAANPSNPATLDATGWPSQDFTTKVLVGDVNTSGTYSLSMNVNQQPNVSVSYASIQNASYNPATHTYTASVVLNAPPGSEVSLAVTNTGGTGARNIRLIRPGYDPNTSQVFSNNYLNWLKSLHPTALRLMNFLNTNNNPVRTWDQRTLPTDPTQTAALQLKNYDGSPKTGLITGKGIAWEYAIALANAVHADLWINVPAQADDNYIQQLASLIKNGDTVNGVHYAGLDPDLNVYVEYSNEVWNTGLDAFRYTGDAALAEVTTDAAAGKQSDLNYDNQSTTPDSNGQYGGRYVTWGERYYARRLVQISNLFGQTFGAGSINTRIRPVLSNSPNLSQFQNMLNYVKTVFGDPGNYFYSIGMVPYMNMNGPDNTTNTVNGGNNNPNLTPDDVLTNLALNAQALTSQYVQFGSMADSYGLKMTAYEGGVDTSGLEGQNPNGPKAAAGRDPRIIGILQQYFSNWFAHGGDALMYFTSNASPYGGRFGDFVLTDDITNLNAAKAQGFRAGRDAVRAAAAPAAASGVRVTGTTSSTVSVAWTDNSDNESAFKIDLATDNKFTQNLITTVAPANATSLTVTGVPAGTQYFVRVRAANTDGDSVGSNFVIATTGGAKLPPPAPLNVTANAVSSSQLTLTWNDVALNDTGFHVDVATDSAFSHILTTATAPTDATSFNVYGLDSATAFYFRVRATNAAGDSANSNTAGPVSTLPQTVTGYWTFDEPSGNVANDSGAAPANQGNLIGGVTHVAGYSGGALQFDGSTGYVDLGSLAKLQLSGQGTVSAWIKPNAISATQDIVIRDWDGLNYPYYLKLDADGQDVRFGTLRQTAPGAPFVEAKGNAGYRLDDGNWHFIAGTYDGALFKVFIDGKLVATKADPYGLTTGPEPLEFGRNANNGGGSHDYYNGAIDEVRIWNVGVSDGDLARLAAQSPGPQTIPVAPSNLQASPASGTQVNLAWNDNSNNESGFTVEKSVDNANWLFVTTTEPNATSTSVTGLNPGGTYYFRVRAFNSAGSSANTTAGPVTTPTTATTPPTAPSNLTGHAVSGSEIDLAWSDNSNNEDGFTVDQSLDNTNWTNVTTTGAGANTYNVTGLNAGANYYFRVRAFNSAGTSTYATAGPIATPGSVPAAPAQFSARAVSTSEIDLTWKDVSQNENGFTIEQSLDNANWSLLVNTGVGVTAYDVTGLSAGTAYYFRIRSFNSAGASANVTTGPVSTNTNPTAPTAPSNLNAQAVSSSQINLTWTDNSNNETGFIIEDSTDNATWTAVTTTAANVTSASVTGLSAGTAYSFRVRATNATGDSGNASAGPVSTLPNSSPSTQLTGTPFGTAGSYGNLGNTFAKALDSDFSTYFDAPTPSGDYVGLDLGSAQTLSAVRYAPRAGFEQRMVGGTFQGSNTSATSGFVDLFTITTKPAAGVFSTATITDPASYRWVRYLAPDNSYGNVAELEFDGPAASPPPAGGKLTGTLIGTAGSYGNQGNTIAKAVDQNFSSFFDAPSPNGDYLGYDLGTAAVIGAVKFAPRAGFESRMVGGKFQGSNASPTSGFVDLFTITTAPAAGTFTTATITDPTAYRYIRYLAPDGSYGNVAEIEFDAAGPTQPPPTDAKLNGTSFGTAGSYNNLGNTYAKALDGDPTTYFDAPTANGDYVGLDLGSPQVITTVKFAPRSGFPSRMVGGKFQGSNTSPTDGFVDLYTITSAPAAGSITAIPLSGTTAYRYVRYLAPDGSYGNVAELEFDGRPAATTPTKLTGAPFGTAGSYNNLGNTYAKALDGDPTTYFDAPTPNGNNVGLDLGAARQITSVRFAPRATFASRMVGGKFQGSNSPTGGWVDLFTVTTAPTDGAYTTATISDPTAYRYVRYLAPDGSWGNVAEIEFYG